MPIIMRELVIAYCIIMEIFWVIYFFEWLYNEYITWAFEQ